jgi:hypothetical protein
VIPISGTPAKPTTEAQSHRELEFKKPQCLCVSVVDFGFLLGEINAYAKSRYATLVKNSSNSPFDMSVKSSAARSNL